MFDWTNDEHFKNLEELAKLEFFMKNGLLLRPESDIPTYCPATNTVSMSTGFSFNVPKKFKVI